jgi:4-amino-4-deoxy-L-arabinose transferase-like glycosyltransferase
MNESPTGRQTTDPPPKKQDGAQRGLTVVLFLLILLLAAVLRTYNLGGQSLWNDEGTSVALAQRGLAAIARDAARDIHPPLYYWLLSGWVRATGTSEFAVRSLSALLGVVLAGLTYSLGRLLASRWVGLVAMFLAATHPFQVYYAQEARMYMLAAVLAAGVVLALGFYVRESESWRPLAALLLLEAAGLYTHYAFIFMVLIVNLAFLLWLWQTRDRGRITGRFGKWTLSQILAALLYLPWLPVAVQQTTSWPAPTGAEKLATNLATAGRWLVLGPTVEMTQVVFPLLLAAVLATLGAVALAVGWLRGDGLTKEWSAALLSLWAGLPVLLIFALGLYREAYLKFLLIATPALCLLLSCGLLANPPIRAGREAAARRQSPPTLDHPPRVSRPVFLALRLAQALTIFAILVASGLALRNYYSEPAYARDDYRSIADYVTAVGNPGDAVLLNAPGQQEVFSYYYQGSLPVHALPRERPLDPVATEQALAEMVEPGQRLFALFWATDESDPDRFVEGWLDKHAYKAIDSWYGNVRLVTYAVPEQMPSAPDHTLGTPLTSSETGDEVFLQGYSLLDDRLSAGDIAQFTLFWQASQAAVQRYKVFLHVLDAENHIVGQRDAEPGGGARLTTLWEPGELVADNHGVPIHPATPPGEYRVEVGMYSLETGQRLTAPGGSSQVWLEPLTVKRPQAAVPTEALGMEHTTVTEFGDLTLLGYDMHKLGFAHQPDAPLQPGDVLQVSLYWRAQTDPIGDWELILTLLGPDQEERATVAAEPVGGYPTSLWKAGDLWRGQFDIGLAASAEEGPYQLRIEPLAPDGTTPGVYLSEPQWVGR